jgi:anti-anti-sigma factor
MSATQHPSFTPFTVDVDPQRDLVRVCPHGELDLSTAELLRDRFTELTSAGFSELLLDLRELTFLDSTGLRLVLELQRWAEADGWELAVIDGRPEVARIFDLTGVRALVPFVDGDPRWVRAWR